MGRGEGFVSPDYRRIAELEQDIFGVTFVHQNVIKNDRVETAAPFVRTVYGCCCDPSFNYVCPRCA